MVNYPITCSLTDVTKSNVEGYFNGNFTVTDCNGLVISVRGVGGLNQENLNNFEETTWEQECEESIDMLAQEEQYIYYADWDNLDYFPDETEY